MSLFKFANFVATELEEGISAGATEMMIPLAASEQLPTLDIDEVIRLVLWDGQQDPEIVSVTENEQTGVLTIERGAEDTTAKAWEAGTQVRCVLTAEIINTALAAFFDIETVLAASFLPLVGGTLTGELILPSGTPLDSLAAVPKSYVDTLGAGALPTSGGVMSGNINMGSNEVVSLPNPTVASSATRKSYVDNLISGVQGQIAAGTAVYTTTGTASAYVVTTVGGDIAEPPSDGYAVIIRPHVTNALNATLKVDAADAKPIQLRAGDNVTAGILNDFTPYTVVYDENEDAFVIAGTINLATLEAQVAALEADVADLEVQWKAPVGTHALAVQVAAPTGWTISAAANDRVLRVVSGATGGSTGGTWVISGLAVGNHTLTIDEIPSHSHEYNKVGTKQVQAGGSAQCAEPPSTDDTSNTGGGDPHNHPLTSAGTWRPAYLDVIRIVKS